MADQYIDNRYRLRRKLIPGEPQRGVPDLWAAEDAGDVYFVKVWRRGSGDQSDVNLSSNVQVFATWQPGKNTGASRPVRHDDVLPRRGGIWFDVGIKGGGAIARRLQGPMARYKYGCDGALR